MVRPRHGRGALVINKGRNCLHNTGTVLVTVVGYIDELRGLIVVAVSSKVPNRQVGRACEHPVKGAAPSGPGPKVARASHHHVVKKIDDE